MRFQGIPKSKTLRQDFFFFAGLCAVTAFSFWKCRFGFPVPDEGLYLSVPQRLWAGDAAFVEEWNLSQLSGLLLVPLYGAYTFFTGGTEGIFLAFRQGEVLFQMMITAALYLRIRHKGSAAVAAAFVYGLSVPLRLMCLSYNTMGFGLLMLCGAILATPERGFGGGWIFFCGVLFACATLCTPSLTLLYVVYTLSVMAALLLRRKKPVTSAFFKSYVNGRVWGMGTLGLAVSAAAVIGFLLSRASLAQLLRCVPFLLEDPDHPVGGGIWLKKDVLRILNSFVLSRYSLAFYGLFVLWAALLLWCLLDRNRGAHTARYVGIGTCLTAAFLLLFAVQDLENHVLFPLTLLGILCYALTEHKNCGLLAFWSLGIGYACALNIASNLYFRAVSMGTCLSSVAGVLMAAELMREKNLLHGAGNARRAALGLCAVLCLQLGAEAWQRATLIFLDAPIPQLTQTLESGPIQGICTTPATAQRYEEQREDFTAVLAEHNAEMLLVPCDENWYYLAAPSAGCAAFSSFICREDDSFVKRLLSYYQLNPKKVPTLIYISKTSAWTREQLVQYAERFGFVLEENRRSYCMVPA